MHRAWKSLTGLAGRAASLLAHQDWTSVYALVQIAVFTAIPSLAWVSATDPTWLPGTYDGADGDDVIYVVTATAAQRQADPPEVRRCILVAAGIVPVPADCRLRSTSTSEFRPRSPPPI